MKPDRLTLIRLFLLLLSVTFLIIGVFLGEYVSVLNKSIRICLECIGIG